MGVCVCGIISASFKTSSPNASVTDPVGRLWSGDGRQLCHLPHNPGFLCGVRRWGRLQLGAVVEWSSLFPQDGGGLKLHVPPDLQSEVWMVGCMYRLKAKGLLPY